MIPALQITPPQWMRDPACRRLLALLGPDKTRLVGGCVRNHFLNYPVHDIDISTELTPDVVCDILGQNKVRVIPTGIKYGTVTALVGGKKYEITTLRCDEKTDGRHAEILYTDSWHEDASRRDFTMNALYADCEGNIFDPVGAGLADLEARLVRFIGDPEKRIAEDHLRILRYFRFLARYGENTLDPASFAACRQSRALIGKLSAERIMDELYKMLGHHTAPDAVAFMAKAMLFEEEGLTGERAAHLARLVDLQERYGADNADARFYLLFSEYLDSKKFIYSNKIKQFFDKLNKVMAAQGMVVKELLYRYGHDATVQGLMIRAAETGSDDEGDIRPALAEDIPVFPLTASRVMRVMDVSQGPEIGRIMRQAEKIWIENGFSDRADDLIVKIKQDF